MKFKKKRGGEERSILLCFEQSLFRDTKSRFLPNIDTTFRDGVLYFRFIFMFLDSMITDQGGI